MKSYDEWCLVFQGIEKDPSAKMNPPWTVRDLIAAKQHIAECKWCAASMDRVYRAAPPEKLSDQTSKN